MTGNIRVDNILPRADHVSNTTELNLSSKIFLFNNQDIQMSNAEYFQFIALLFLFQNIRTIDLSGNNGNTT